MGTTQEFCVLFGIHLFYNHDDLKHNCNIRKYKTQVAQSAGAVEYTDCTSAER